MNFALILFVLTVVTGVIALADRLFFAPWERFLHRRWGTGVRG